LEEPQGTQLKHQNQPNSSEVTIMYFYDPQNRPIKVQRQGVQQRTFWSDRLMFSLVDLEANSIIPPHSHPHEQGTFLLKGECEVTIGAETRWVRSGELFIIPGNVVHSVKVGPEPVQALDAFVPAREDLMY
jgi:quercetin dioxygenase-like cupin family protein